MYRKYQDEKTARFLWYIFCLLREQIEGEIKRDQKYQVEISGEVLLSIYMRAKWLFESSRIPNNFSYKYRVS